MVEETGLVTQIKGAMATVLVQKKSACDGCSVQGACESTAEGMEIEALNMVHAGVGQKVKVAMAPRDYLKGSMFMYVLPLIVFIAGAIIGKNIGETYLKNMNSDLVAAMTGFALLVLSLAGLKLWTGKMESRAEYKPVIEEIIGDTVQGHEL
jgi:sigma-E factor negative regulatory protein RseC